MTNKRQQELVPQGHIEVPRELVRQEPQDLTPAPRDKTQHIGNRAKLEAMRARDTKLVRGIFRNFETPGGILRFSAKAFPQEKVQKFTLYDGEVCTIPLGIARHLAKDCWIPVHEHAVDVNGRPSIQLGRQVHRFGFQSLEFMADESLEPSMIEKSVPNRVITI